MNSLSDDHSTLKVCNKVAKLLEPLRSFDINFICFIRIFCDKSRVVLCSDKNWVKHFFYNELYKYPILGFHDNPENVTENFTFLLSIGLPYIPTFVHALDQHSIGNFWVIVEKEKDYTDYMYFGSSRKDRHISNFFVNHIDLFKTFLEYFRVSTRSEIDRLSASKLIVDVSTITSDITSAEIFNPHKIKQFYKSINSELSPNQAKTVSFTEREKDCIELLINGLSARQIGENLEISQRTAETHINNIKVKIGCNKKSDLIRNLLGHYNAKVYKEFL